MKETGILFTPENYTKVEAGKKWMTRRLQGLEKINASPDDWAVLAHGDNKSWRFVHRTKTVSQGGGIVFIKCPFGTVGDRLFGCLYIPNVPHTYCASGDGVIYSRARGDWRPLKAHSGNPYPAVTIMDGKKKLTRNIHTLICSAFYGPLPFPGAQVRHLDGDYYNSRPDNLCWGTQLENWNDRKAHGNGCEGEKHHDAKFTDEERAHIRWAIEKGLASRHQAARALGIAQSTVTEMMNGAELRPVEQVIPPGRLHPLWLEITAIRVERLHEITETDAKAEGTRVPPLVYPDRPHETYSYVENFQLIWQSIHGPGAWEANQYVWVLSFRRIDAS